MGKRSPIERSSKEHKHKKKSSKDKRGKKDRHRSSKERRQKRRRSDSTDSSSSDGDASPRLSTAQQLAMGRAAARACREILAHDYGLRKDLRELARQLDGGGALDVSGLPDPFLRARLEELLGNLPALRRSAGGAYYLRRGEPAAVLAFLAPILDESPESLAAYRRAPEPVQPVPEAAPAPAEGGAAATAGARAAAPQRQPIGPAGPPPAQRQQQQQPEQEYAEGLVDSEGDDAELGATAAPVAAQRDIGVALLPPNQEQQQPQQQQQDAEVVGKEDESAPRRVVGPAMPSAAMLAAAAAMEVPHEEEEEAEEDELLVGPPPPELAEEVDLASMDERSAEVARVMRVLEAHVAAHAGKSAAELAECPPDAYEVLGLEHSAPSAEVKRRYWRLSLLVHPDKCEHPRAHDAFQAVSAAARALQDAGTRAAVDARREDARLRRLHAQHVAAEERARQWRLARGQATAADLAGPAPAVGPGGGPARETWMTELPPERQAVVGAMPTGGFQGFSSRGKTGRGNTSEWTMTPQQRALQLEGGGGEGEDGQPLLRLGGAPGDAAHAARTAVAVDTFNAAVRKKSLVEQHQERLAAEAKAAKKAKRQKAGGDKGSDRPLGPAAASGGEDWDRSAHPWRPWDREKEMGGSGAKPADAKKFIESSRNLTSRFGGGSQQRSFL